MVEAKSGMAKAEREKLKANNICSKISISLYASTLKFVKAFNFSH
jgi:hypothetical protein